MVILGSTGSIGVNVLNIARDFSLEVEVLSAGNNIELLNRQIKEFHPKLVVVADEESVSKVAHKNVLFGREGILEAIRSSKSDLVVNALVGFLGLKPTLEAIECGKRVALANKESLVVGGKFVDISKVSPIDSEHFAVWYLLGDRAVEKVIITASGGPFRDTPIEEIRDKTAKEALAHPNWSMGKKISIDSATMTNKLFELLEAKWFFGIDSLDALIERKSVLHALVEFVDGSTTAHFAGSDMRLPIAYALVGDKIDKNILPHIDLLKISTISFEKIDPKRYPIWAIKDEVLSNPDTGVVINAANEVAVERFLANEIGFLDISHITLEAFYRYKDIVLDSVEKIFEVDKEVREFAKSLKR